jgi:hypothetical protein
MSASPQPASGAIALVAAALLRNARRLTDRAPPQMRQERGIPGLTVLKPGRRKTVLPLEH